MKANEKIYSKARGRHSETRIPREKRDIGNYDLDILERIQARVLWLSMQMIHYANSVRDNPDGVKVGGHQASSASVVSLMTALYFHALRQRDRVSIKPHASPVYHAIQFLLGNLPAEKLKEFRSFRGLQAYPSRTKDVDGVDISTGSVGLGAVAPNFAALAQEFVHDHIGSSATDRFIALVGDAELDEGNVWEALGEENLRALRRVLWIVDLNRQSLDRVIPSGKAQKIEEMFRVNGWHVLELKYGRRLEEVFARPGGQLLRRRIDLMSNDEYQSLLRLDDEVKIRERLAQNGKGPDEGLLQLLQGLPGGEMKSLLSDLGGHDLKLILEALEEADRISDRPVVLVAYTIKGWGLPIAGDPLNHSQLLTTRLMAELQQQLGIPRGKEFGGFPEGSPEARYIQAHVDRGKSRKQERVAPGAPSHLRIPETLNSTYKGEISTQQVLGSLLMACSRMPAVAARMVTTSPDVAISTNLGGWINKMGVYGHKEMTNYFRENRIGLVLNWDQSPRGHHIELGISENNFFLLLNMLGLAQETNGETLLPVGTLYDPFICRGLDALIYAAYSEAKFIFAGTPSGISLSREGGAHQSIITPSIGIELPNVVYYEPAFAQELEWILLAGLKNLLDRKHGRIIYLRLSTRAIPQELFPHEQLTDESNATTLRNNILRGGYRLVDYQNEPSYIPGENVVNIFTCGAMVPDAIEASRQLRNENVFGNVINVTSPDLLYRSWRQASKLKMKDPNMRVSFHLDRLIPPTEHQVPVVTVMDGHSHTLSFLGGVFGTKAIALGVDEFGQSGSRSELYDRYEISTKAIVQAARQSIEG